MVAAADVVARWLAIGGIAVGLVSPAITLWIWRRSGSRLRVTLRFTEMTSDRLEDIVRIEVATHGSQSAVVKRIHLGVRKPSGAIQSLPAEWFLSPAPTDGRDPLPRMVEPTDFLVSDVPITSVAEHCGWDHVTLLQAAATRGDGKFKRSRVVRLRTPRKPAA